ncbi:N-glycosidase YbiA-like [Gigantopelta aegis]|uniref:N-glycosidase YbiA-like n=1 Tax=Gigantopelta aegis TaxID=1735272 RepID=UPI001B8873AE|nr:N-glycosidase YbiA-like [Gigantopelta aegis]
MATLNQTDDKECEVSCSQNNPQSTVEHPNEPDCQADKVEEEYVLFFGKDSPFSQHHPAEFEIDGITFNCAEQYMMYMKAVTFKDEEIKEKILQATNPVVQKRLGRKVRNFELDVWKKKCEEIVKRATEQKFSQNEDLKKQLLATSPKTFVECNHRDCVWGIGLGVKNPAARDRTQWRGKNLLGFIITEVRNELLAEAQK